MTDTQLLIVGAGPYGLSTAAYARQRGLDVITVGTHMGFWRNNMPEGMLLRSPTYWHFDPAETHTFERFIREQGKTPADVLPIPVSTYLDYARWFSDAHGVAVKDELVTKLERTSGGYRAALSGGGEVKARSVLVATGLRDHRNIPERIAEELPRDRYSHSSDWRSFERLAAKRCLIVGGRQSAFECAALIREAGAAEVHLVYRHDTPAFESADDGWMNLLFQRTPVDPGWYKKLPEEERKSMEYRAWADGRLKLEVWLKSRVFADRIQLWPNTNVLSARIEAGQIRAQLDTGTSLSVDQLIFATGFKVDVRRISCLAPSLIDALAIESGVPELDPTFAALDGLYFAGLVAMKQFGPFYNFSVGSRVAAKVIVEAIAR